MCTKCGAEEPASADDGDNGGKTGFAAFWQRIVDFFNRIRDFFLTAKPAVPGRYAGVWEMTVETEGEVETSVYDWEGNLVTGPFSAKTFPVPDVKPWSAESPTCYKVVLNNGSEWVSAVFGFRVSEIRDGRYFLNGQKIKLKGANRHETDPLYAWLPREGVNHVVSYAGDAFLKLDLQ